MNFLSEYRFPLKLDESLLRLKTTAYLCKKLRSRTRKVSRYLGPTKPNETQAEYGLARLFLFFSQIVNDKPLNDPHVPFLECLSYSELANAERRLTATTDAKLCDHLLVPGWFRFQGDAGTKMPTFCPAKGSCGTDAPGWLNGAHPTMAEGQVTRQVCFHYHFSCCEWSLNIQVRNCHTYYVYYLRRSYCNLVYCGSD